MGSDITDSKIKWIWKEALSSFFIIYGFFVVLYLLMYVWGEHYVEKFAYAYFMNLPKGVIVLLLSFAIDLPPLIVGIVAFYQIYFIAIKKRGARLKDLFIIKERYWQNILIGFSVGVALLFCYKIFRFLKTGYFTVWLLDPNNLLSIKIPYIFVDSIFISVWQEIFFIAFLYQALKVRFRLFRAFLITACLFVLVHIPNFLYIIPRYFVHVFISVWLFEKRKSIIPSIAFHMTYNLLI